jgi:hypothetical protein
VLCDINHFANTMENHSSYVFMLMLYIDYLYVFVIDLKAMSFIHIT